jgi:hypothetical protein
MLIKRNLKRVGTGLVVAGGVLVVVGLNRKYNDMIKKGYDIGVDQWIGELRDKGFEVYVFTPQMNNLYLKTMEALPKKDFGAFQVFGERP